MPDSEAKRKWKAENTKNLIVTINKNTDKDIFEFLEALDKPYGGTIKAILKDYIKNNKLEQR